MEYLIGAGVMLVLVLAAALPVYHANKGKVAEAYEKFLDLKAVVDTLLEVAKGDGKATGAATKSFGGSAVADLSVPISMIWDWVKRGKKTQAVDRMNRLIKGQKVYRWFWSKIKPNADAVAQANATIAYLKSERDKMLAYQP